MKGTATRGDFSWSDLSAASGKGAFKGAFKGSGAGLLIEAGASLVESVIKQVSLVKMLSFSFDKLQFFAGCSL